MKVVQGKFGNYFELDIKDDKTKEFFKSSEETLLRAGGGCLGEKPWNIKSPLINYGESYTVRCKIYSNSENRKWSFQCKTSTFCHINRSNFPQSFPQSSLKLNHHLSVYQMSQIIQLALT